MTTTIIKGRGKGGSNQTRTPVEAPDSIQSIARAKVLIALGEGEFAGGLDGKNIFLGDSSSYTPLQNADGSYNFNNVKYEFRSGTQDQDYIQGFPGIENELQVSYELKQAVPYVRAVSNTQLSALRIRWDGQLFYSRKTTVIKSAPASSMLSICRSMAGRMKRWLTVLLMTKPRRFMSAVTALTFQNPRLAGSYGFAESRRIPRA